MGKNRPVSFLFREKSDLFLVTFGTALLAFRYLVNILWDIVNLEFKPMIQRGKAIFGVEEYDSCPVNYLIGKRGGWVWHAEGHPYWHPLSLSSEPFTLELNDGRRFEVFLKNTSGTFELTAGF